MRVHRRFGQLAPKIDAERFHRLVRPEHLAAGRLDTGYSARIDNYGLLDLLFSDGAETISIPYLIVQGMQLFMREASPFVWPAWLPPTRKDVARQIEEALEPWLRAQTIARFAGGEIVARFGTDEKAHAAFDRARSCGFLGAAPTERVLVDAAPYVYALRFARDARIAVRDPDGATGAAILARVGSVDVDLGDEARTAEARSWFGLDIFETSAARGGTYDVSIGLRDRLEDAGVAVATDGVTGAERRVQVSRPIPSALMISFDVSDGICEREFGVRAPAVELRASAIEPAAIIGGSAGRIGLVLRDDYRAIDDGDVDAARALLGRLEDQGFAPSIVGASRARAADFDLLHVFGFGCASALRATIGTAPSPPIVLQPHADDPKNAAIWGITVTREALANTIDESMRDLYARAVASRLLTAPNAPLPGTSFAADADVRWLFAAARAAVVASEEEERRIRADFGFTGESKVVTPVLADEPPAQDVGSLVGTGDFVFVHAPIDSRCNQYLLARACAQLGYRLVIAGPVGATDFYGEVLAFLGDDAMVLPLDELTEGQLAALYRRARVFCDLAWTGAGLYRLARAGCAGAALVASSASYARTVWPGHVQLVDPGSGGSIAAGVQAAWEAAPRLGPATAKLSAERCRPFASLVGVLAAYQAAAAPQPVS